MSLADIQLVRFKLICVLFEKKQTSCDVATVCWVEFKVEQIVQ